MNVRACGMCAALWLAAIAPGARAQTGSPPVLSTAADPPPGMVATPAQMSGMPLQVGDLPPGVVVVRVIRRDFGTDVVGQAVTLRQPFSSRTAEAVTDGQGRARFDQFAVGTTVQAHATLDGEVLSSQIFALPSDGGVRLVLTSGVGAGVPSIASDVVRTTAGDGTAASRRPAGWAGAFMMLFGGTALVLGALWLRRRPHASSVSAPEETHPRQAASRSAAFEELVRIEKQFRAGCLAEDDYRARREQEILSILALDASVSGSEKETVG